MKRLEAEETLENPVTSRVPKVQGESRISQAKGQSEHRRLRLSVFLRRSCREDNSFFIGFEKEKKKCKKYC